MIHEHVISHEIYHLSLKCYIQKRREIPDPEQFTKKTWKAIVTFFRLILWIDLSKPKHQYIYFNDTRQNVTFGITFVILSMNDVYKKPLTEIDTADNLWAL